MKKFWEEFKAFALKGNMMDMAIGVIIGGAFSTLVTSLTDNLISPILGILGKVNFDAMMWDVFGDGKLVFKYGAFITAVINFLIMAFVLFLIVKGMNKLMDMGKKEEAPAEPKAPAAPTQEELLASILGGAEEAERGEVGVRLCRSPTRCRDRCLHCGVAQRSMPLRGIEPHERASFAG